MGAGYKVIKKLGEGAFGSVELIEKDHKYYALKSISLDKFNKNDVDQYQKEAKILSILDSKYIVKYYDSYIKKNKYYILMEYGGSSNLKKYIKQFKEKHQLIDEKIIENIIIKICLGLKEIHKHKIIHRDLKPENIFMNEKNEIKIGDFGISKLLNSTMYASTTNIGTIYYMAPEIITQKKYDSRVDIYSLGCIIYELFTLNVYYIDKIDKDKKCKIDTDIYDPKWQILIDLLLNKDYNKRLYIDEVYNYFTNTNVILLTIKVNADEIGKKIYFFR